jgi:GDP-L-fucose synthase
MSRDAKIYVAGHRGMVGSAIVRRLQADGYRNIVTRSRSELDLLDKPAVHAFLQREKPDYVFIATATVGGIHANNNYRADFLYQNLVIEANLVHGAHLAGVPRLMFLGSSCIYPRDCPQPIEEEYLLTGPLEVTNEPYAIAKIGIELCESYNHYEAKQRRRRARRVGHGDAAARVPVRRRPCRCLRAPDGAQTMKPRCSTSAAAKT